VRGAFTEDGEKVALKGLEALEVSLVGLAVQPFESLRANGRVRGSEGTEGEELGLKQPDEPATNLEASLAAGCLMLGAAVPILRS
jgi:hypothetical protein